MEPRYSRSYYDITPLPESQPVKARVAYFAGGCFWGIQHYFKKGPGILDAVSGYAQGSVGHPTYREICTDTTGHAETVRVLYDPARISYRRLLEAFFAMHDPTQLNGQGPDFGRQYRSGIWTTDEDQRREAESYVMEQQFAKRYGARKIVTQVEPLRAFWPAEEYHQDYLAKNGAACHVRNPWLDVETSVPSPDRPVPAAKATLRQDELPHLVVARPESSCAA